MNTLVSSQLPPLRAFAFSFLFCCVALIFRLLLDPLVDGGVIYLLFTLAVMVSSTFWGFLPGVFSTLLSAFFCVLFILPPVMGNGEGSKGADLVQLFLFLTVGFAMSVSSESFRRARIRISQGEAALQKTSEELTNLIGAVKEYSFFSMDESGSIISWNPSVERLLGYTEEEFIGRSAEIIFTPEDISERALYHELDEARTKGSSRDERWHCKKNNTRFWASGVVCPRYDKKGNLIGFTKVIGDFTRLKLAQQEAEEANRIKDEFLAVLSHELRTPMNAVLGWAQLLQRKTTDTELLRGLTVIERNIRTQSQLISDLLDMSAITSGKTTLSPTEILLSSVVSDAVDSLRPQLEEKGITLDTLLPPSPRPIHADAHRLHQVIGNLLSNALKYTPSGGTVSVTLTHEDEFEVIRVTDTGEGIEPEHVPYLFEKFYQGTNKERGRRPTGLGLGLSVVRQIVELHQGEVEVFSKGKGAGSTFVVKLPISHPSHQVLAASNRTESTQFPPQQSA